MPFMPGEEGKPIKKTPLNLVAFLPQWPNAQNECLEYSFGFITTHKVTDAAGSCYTCYISNTRKRIVLTQNVQAGGMFLLVQKNNIQDIAFYEESGRTLEEVSCTITYFPSGENLFNVAAGTAALLLVDIDSIMYQFMPDSILQHLQLHIQQYPAVLYELPVVTNNAWLHGLINLLLNTGKDSHYIPELHNTLKKVIAIYMNEIDDNIPLPLKEKLQLSILSGRVQGKSYLLYQSRKESLYNDIIAYLVKHLKTNYNKKNIAIKSGLSEKNFSRIFQEGYGKTFKEGYLELRLTEVFRQVIQNNKLAEIAHKSGYTSASNLSVSFKKMYGNPPSLYQWPYRINTFIANEYE